MTNFSKKQKIDEVLAQYSAKISLVREKRDKIIKNFREALRQKRIEEVKSAIHQ